jgi:dTDP-4-amino-4,6-dideoxygalactose transaminase
MYVSNEHGLSPATLWQAPVAGPLPFPLDAPGRMYFYRARNAIYHLFRALGFEDGGTVLVPDYHNSNEVLAIRAAGAPIRFYRIGRNLEPDLEQLEKLCRTENPRALYLIHYFGWAQPMKDLVQLCQERGMLLIEDCALALLSETGGRPLGSFGHFAIFCLYKTLPVPNGGVLARNDGPLPGLAELRLRSCGMVTAGGRTLELMLEWLRSRSYRIGQTAFAGKRAIGRALRWLRVERVPFGDIGFDLSTVDVAISKLSMGVLRRLDYATIRQRRRDNFLLFRERLDGHATMFPRELEEGMCPYIFPLLVRDKAAAVRALQAVGIAAQEFWNFGVPDARGAGFEDAQFLHDHVLELPVHQDVAPAQVEYMAAEVRRLGLRL